MKNNIAITFILLALMFSAFISCQLQKDEVQLKEMTITTSSEEALELFLEGRDLYFMTKNDSAAMLFDKAIELDPNFAMAYDFRAWSGTDNISRKKARKKAFDLIDKVSLGEKYWILFDDAWADNDYDNTIKYLDSFLLLYPEDKHGVYFAGAAHHYLAFDYEKALHYYDKTLELDEKFILAYVDKKNAQINLGQFDKAEKTIQQHIKLLPDEAIPYFSYGQLLTKLGRFDESIEQHNIALEKDPELKYTNYQLGHNYTLKGEYEKAREYYWKFTDQEDPETKKLGPLFFEAVTYLYEDTLGGFLNKFEEYRMIAEKNERWDEFIYSYIHSGTVFNLRHNTVEANKYYDKATDLIEQLPLNEKRHEYFEVFSGKCKYFLLLEEGRLKEAKALSGKIERDIREKKVYPDPEKEINYLHAKYEMAQGNFDEAIGLFSKSYTDRIFPMYNMAKCYEKAGNKEKALEYYLKIKNFNEVTWPAGSVWNKVLNKIEVLETELQGTKIETS